MTWPDCSPPSTAPDSCSASSTYRSPTDGRQHLDAALAHQCVEAEVRHHRHRNLVDLEVEREDRDDLVAVDGFALLVDGEHAVTVAVERDPEVVAAVAHGLLEQREVGRAAADVDVRAVGRIADRVHLGAAARRRRAAASPE